MMGCICKGLTLDAMAGGDDAGGTILREDGRWWWALYRMYPDGTRGRCVETGYSDTLDDACRDWAESDGRHHYRGRSAPAIHWCLRKAPVD